jgi:hypothetical protein
MVLSVVCHPGHRFTGSVEDGEEYENVLNNPIQPQRPMRK